MIVETADLPHIEVRMLRWMTGIALVSAVYVFARFDWRVGIGFVIGSLLGILNFHWLWQTVNTLMGAQSAHVPFATAFLMVARFPIAFGVLIALYFGGWVPLLPLIAGLLIPGAGVLVESLFLVGAELRHKQTA